MSGGVAERRRGARKGEWGWGGQASRQQQLGAAGRASRQAGRQQQGACLSWQWCMTWVCTASRCATPVCRTAQTSRGCLHLLQTPCCQRLSARWPSRQGRRPVLLLRTSRPASPAREEGVAVSNASLDAQAALNASPEAGNRSERCEMHVFELSNAVDLTAVACSSRTLVERAFKALGRLRVSRA